MQLLTLTLTLTLTLPLIRCPACPAVLNTMQLLTRHYARKHMSGERLFECSHCGLKFATSNDCGSHQKLCLRGDNAGKVIRCDACGEEFTLAKVRARVRVTVTVTVTVTVRVRVSLPSTSGSPSLYLPITPLYLPYISPGVDIPQPRDQA